MAQQINEWYSLNQFGSWTTSKIYISKKEDEIKTNFICEIHENETIKQTRILPKKHSENWHKLAIERDEADIIGSSFILFFINNNYRLHGNPMFWRYFFLLRDKFRLLGRIIQMHFYSLLLFLLFAPFENKKNIMETS